MSRTELERTEASESRATRLVPTWLALGVFLVWAGLVLVIYYSKVRLLLDFRDLDWQQDMSSLSFVTALPQSLSGFALPALSEAVVRATVSTLTATAILLAADGAGWLFSHSPLWRLSEPPSLVFRIGVGIPVLSLATLLLTVTGLVGALSVWLVISPLALLAAAREIDSARSRAEGRAIEKGGGIWAIVSLFALAIAFVVALAPEIEYDAVWYHLGLPRIFLEEGSLWASPIDPTSAYPMGWEMLYTMAMAIGGPGAAKLLHFAALPLTAAVVHGLARRALPRVSPWLPVAIFVTIPTVLWEATTAYVDLALTFHTALVLFSIVRFMETKADGWLWLGSLNLGMALATKHLALLVALLTISGLALIVRREEGRWLLRPSLILATGFILALPWYLRAAIETGNPVFPELYALFGAPPLWWDGATEAGLDAFKETFGGSWSLGRLWRLPWDLTIHGASFGGSLGPLLLVFAPFAFLGKTTRVLRALTWFALFYLAIWVSPLSSLQMRFLLPITPILALLAAQGASALAGRVATSRLAVRSATTALAFLLLLNLPPFTSLHESDRVGWDGWLTHVVHDVPITVVAGAESEEEYLSRKLPAFEAWRYAESEENARFVLNFTGEDRLYGTTWWVASHTTMVRPAISAEDPVTAMERFDALGLTHILASRASLESGDTPELLAPSTLTAGFRIDYQDERVVLYERLRQ